MATGISAFGERGISGTFGFDSNELHRRVYLADPKNQLLPLLKQVFGENAGDLPKQFPAPFDSFRAWTCSFDQNSDKGTQGDTEDTGDFSMLDSFPTIRGGLVIDILYRPMDDYGNGFHPVTDETWDFSAQTMSLIGNNFGANKTSLWWNDGKTPISNLQVITKVIPKVELTQKFVYCRNLPPPIVLNLIGCINDASLTLGASGEDNQSEWPAGTVLLVGLPSVRRWRFDGQQIFEVGIKLAINMYQGLLEDGSYGYVTWNRLYRPGNDEINAHWDTVKIGADTDKGKTLMYQSDNLAELQMDW